MIYSLCQNGTSTKRRIKTFASVTVHLNVQIVRMVHPLKEGLRPVLRVSPSPCNSGQNGTSTKRRIKTSSYTPHNISVATSQNGTSTKRRIKTRLSFSLRFLIFGSQNGTSTKRRIKTLGSIT